MLEEVNSTKPSISVRIPCNMHLNIYTIWSSCLTVFPFVYGLLFLHSVCLFVRMCVCMYSSQPV